MPRLASAQGPPTDENGVPIEVAGEDYFTAQFHPSTQSYLESIENRHASERVWALYRAGKYTEPLGDCKYVLARFPNHPRALHLLSEIAKTTEQLTMPIPYYERALKYYPQHAYTHAQYGHYLVEISATSAGIAELMEALRRDPNQLQAQAWLAQALSAQARSTLADTTKAAPTSAKSGTSGGARN